MTTTEIKTKAKNLKPTKNEISHITTVKPTGMRSQFSIYLSGGKFIIAKGMIFNERQNHEVVMDSKNYNKIVNYLTNQCK